MSIRKYINLVEAAQTQIIAEMPITTAFHGTEEPGSFRDDDRKLIASEKGQEKIRKVWRNSIMDFDLIYYNQAMAPDEAFQKALDKIGPVSQKSLKVDFGLNIKPRPGSVTLIFTQNEGNERIPLTGWMIAHRAFHIFEEASRNGIDRWSHPPRHKYRTIDNAYKPTRAWVDRLSSEFKKAYLLCDADGHPTGGHGFPTSLLGNAVGTTKAARDNNMADFGEIKPEAFAQYLLTGKVRFNTPPASIAWNGSEHEPKRVFKLDPDKAEHLAAFVKNGEAMMEENFKKLLDHAKGKIFIL